MIIHGGSSASVSDDVFSVKNYDVITLIWPVHDRAYWIVRGGLLHASDVTTVPSTTSTVSKLSLAVRLPLTGLGYWHLP